MKKKFKAILSLVLAVLMISGCMSVSFIGFAADDFGDTPSVIGTGTGSEDNPSVIGTGTGSEDNPSVIGTGTGSEDDEHSTTGGTTPGSGQTDSPWQITANSSAEMDVSQTLTLTVTLKSGTSFNVDGMYYGFDPEYANNGYNAFGEKGNNMTVNITINYEGTYYFTFKGTDGSLSDTLAVTFFKTTFNAMGGSVSPSYVLSKEGNAISLPTPEKSSAEFIEWNTSVSGTGISLTSSYTPSGDSTIYAIWEKSGDYENVYNLGEETYSFGNYGDSDSQGGHCFGMSSTSAGYFLGILDVSAVGIDSCELVNTLSFSQTVRNPICSFQDKQGSYSLSATVAGGSYYKTGKSNISADWADVVKYVKNHDFDNTGILQLAIRKESEGGHAINFLRYEVVDGQERIYAYDNNFPTVESYFYKDASGKVWQAPYQTFSGAIDCIALRDLTVYFSIVKDFDESRYIYADKSVINVENAIAEYAMDGGVENEEHVMFELPGDAEEAIIVPLVDNAEFEYIDKIYSFGDVDENTVGVFKLAPSDAEIYEDVPELIIGEKAEITFSEPEVSLNYKGTKKLEPTIKVEDGLDYTVKYESSNPDVAAVDADGNITTTGRGNATITCTVTDEKGIETQESCEVNVKFTFIQWIIWILLLGFLWY